MVLSTSGLFLLAGAQFLAAGTVIVYAGAIIVTFLFVIMLAQMEGRAPYDRAARVAVPGDADAASCSSGRSLYSLFLVKPAAGADVAAGRPATAAAATALPRTDELAPLASRGRADAGRRGRSRARSGRPPRLDDADGRPKPHVAGLGGTLYTDHLITVELAGALLFVALIGALAIATPEAAGPARRPRRRRRPSRA